MTAACFDGLLGADFADHVELLPLGLPGTGAAAPLPGETTLHALAEFVAAKAAEHNATIIVAHSVASIIASLAVQRTDCPLAAILSLEGNLTAEDAYFSGTAADYDNPASFHEAFLARLDGMAMTPVLARYRAQVAQADARSLWELGCDARRFSEQQHPGETLMNTGSAVYLYNPDNCPGRSIEWLERSNLPRLVLDGASHWPSVDQPELLARTLREALELVSPV